MPNYGWSGCFLVCVCVFQFFSETLVSFRIAVFTALACLETGVIVYVGFYLWSFVVCSYAIPMYGNIQTWMRLKWLWQWVACVEETTPAFVCASVAVCSFRAPVPSALSLCYLNDSDWFTRSCHVLRVIHGHILACSLLIWIRFGRVLQHWQLRCAQQLLT